MPTPQQIQEIKSKAHEKAQKVVAQIQRNKLMPLQNAPTTHFTVRRESVGVLTNKLCIISTFSVLLVVFFLSIFARLPLPEH
jgi:hypothetical protein